jgi:hypothetical protein
MWACVCLVVWPLYYAGVMIKALPLYVLSDHLRWNVRLDDALRAPPYLDRLRG